MAALFLWVTAAPMAAADDVARGAYVAAAAGCVSCHTHYKEKGAPFAGGRPLKTPFGIFHAPNITPHREFGIGAWSDADFVRALRDGIAPDGTHYFPAFPYTSYTKITDDDLRALKTYLFSQPPAATPNRPHELRFPFGWRFPVTFWKWRYFDIGPFRPDPSRSAEWNRGAYLARALLHCGECHTARDAMGGPRPDRYLAGARDGPEGEAVPNITPDPERGIGKWSDQELAQYLRSGEDPDGDFAGSLMAEVIDHSTSRLNDADIAAIIAYLRSVPARAREPQQPR